MRKQALVVAKRVIMSSGVNVELVGREYLNSGLHLGTRSCRLDKLLVTMRVCSLAPVTKGCTCQDSESLQHGGGVASRHAIEDGQHVARRVPEPQDFPPEVNTRSQSEKTVTRGDLVGTSNVLNNELIQVRPRADNPIELSVRNSR